MSVALGRRALSQLCVKRCNKFPFNRIASRWRSAAATEENTVTASEKSLKSVIPAPEPGRIQAAILKNFNEPLQIENLEIPKILNPKEVRL